MSSDEENLGLDLSDMHTMFGPSLQQVVSLPAITVPRQLPAGMPRLPLDTDFSGLAATPLLLENVTPEYVECYLPLLSGGRMPCRLLRGSARQQHYTCSGVLELPNHPAMYYLPVVEHARRNVHFVFHYESTSKFNPAVAAIWSNYPEAFRLCLMPLLDEPLSFLQFNVAMIQPLASMLEPVPRASNLLRLVFQKLIQPHELARHQRAYDSVRPLVEAIGWEQAECCYMQWDARYCQDGMKLLPAHTPNLALWQQIGLVDESRRLPCELFSSQRLRHILQELASSIFVSDDSLANEINFDPHDQLMAAFDRHELLVLNNPLHHLDELMLQQLQQEARWFLVPGEPVQESKHFPDQRLPLVVVRHVHLFMPGELSSLLAELYLRPMRPPSEAHLDRVPMLPKLLLEGDFLCDTLCCNDIRAALEHFPDCFLQLEATPQLKALPAYRLAQRMLQPPSPEDPLWQCPVLEMLCGEIGRSIEVCQELPIQCFEVAAANAERVASWRHQKQRLAIVVTDTSNFAPEHIYLLWQRDQHLIIQAPSVEYVRANRPFNQHSVY
jgi:hypothetical protein